MRLRYYEAAMNHKPPSVMNDVCLVLLSSKVGQLVGPDVRNVLGHAESSKQLLIIGGIPVQC